MRKWLIRASVAFNVIVLLSMAGMWIGGGKLVGKWFIEPIHARWVSQFDVLPVKSGDIVFLGDSITEGGVWEDLFSALPVRNRGIGGDVTDGIRARLHQVTDGKPAKIFLLIGTNDLANGSSAADVAANVAKIVDAIRSSSPGTQIYVQSVLPRAASYREKVEELNHLVEQNISGKATWVDLYPLFLDSTDGSIRDDLSNDELHLLGPGYLLWRDKINALVRE